MNEVEEDLNWLNENVKENSYAKTYHVFRKQVDIKTNKAQAQTHINQMAREVKPDFNIIKSIAKYKLKKIAKTNDNKNLRFYSIERKKLQDYQNDKMVEARDSSVFLERDSKEARDVKSQTHMNSFRNNNSSVRAHSMVNAPSTHSGTKVNGFVHKDFTTEREHFVNPLFAASKEKKTFYLKFKENKDKTDITKFMSKTVYTNQDSDKKHFVNLANSLINAKKNKSKSTRSLRSSGENMQGSQTGMDLVEGCNDGGEGMGSENREGNEGSSESVAKIPGSRKPLVSKPTNYMNKKNKDNIRFVFPVVFLNDAKANLRNHSEKRRFSNIMELFLKLKFLIDKDPSNKFSYIREFFAKHGIFDPEIFSYGRMNNFYSYLCSDFNINPSKSVQELIMNGTLYNAPKSLKVFMKKRYGNQGEEDNDQNEAEGNGVDNEQMEHRRHFSVSNSNDHSISCNKDDQSRHVNQEHTHTTVIKADKKPAKHRNISMRDYLAKQPMLEFGGKRLDFRNPNLVIKAVEKEFKTAKIIPRNESFITQLGEFKEVTRGKKKSYEETTLKNVNLNNSFKEKESKRKRKLLEYILLQRSKNQFLLNAEKKRLKIESDLKLIEIDNNFQL